MREEFNEWRLNNLEATYPDTSPMDLGLHCLVRRTEQLSVKPASECKQKKRRRLLKKSEYILHVTGENFDQGFQKGSNVCKIKEPFFFQGEIIIE